jgi:CheY-like chemotaxis protein
MVLSVSDEGIGIPENRIDLVFEEFGQADESTTREYGGTGLGLPITRKFCQMMGGEISVESEPGRGSVFTIELPVKVKTLELAGEEKLTEDSEGEKGVRADHPVLVVDDDPNARDLLKRNLEADGFSVVTAADGKEGLHLAKQMNPSLITLDIMMPEMDGWSVLQSLKEDSELQDIPVIIVSIVGDKEMSASLGAVDYLSKPVDRNHLLKIANQFVLEKGGKRALIVEDDEITRSLLRHALEEADWEVAEAENGAVGLERIKNEDYDLILLDLMMPVMDGFGFLLELRKNNRFISIPVIIVTAKDLTEEERRTLNGGVAYIVEKSDYSTEELLSQVRSVVAKDRRPLE